MTGKLLLKKLAHAIDDLKHEDVEVRERGLMRLAEARWDEMTKLIIPLLNDSSERVRRHAAQFLEHTDRGGAAGVLKDYLLVESSLAVRFWCLHSLRMIPCSNARIEFTRALKDESEDITLEAIGALGELGDLRAISSLKPLLMSESWYVRLYTSIALIMLGCKDPIILSTLFDLMNSEEGSYHDEQVKRQSEDMGRPKVGGVILAHNYWLSFPLADIYSRAERMIQE